MPKDGCYSDMTDRPGAGPSKVDLTEGAEEAASKVHEKV